MGYHHECNIKTIKTSGQEPEKTDNKKVNDNDEGQHHYDGVHCAYFKTYRQFKEK